MGSAEDVRVYREALLAAADGPFFPDWEFPLLFGLERDEFRSIAHAFSEATELAGSTALAVRGALNNLVGYPHNEEAAWPQWLSVSPDELELIYERWRARRHVA